MCGRARTRRFTYIVYYRALNDRVEVVAVLHGRRDASTWTTRA
jgi:plasmid stabilization system protein ParE